jgi:hypothetical protein
MGGFNAKPTRECSTAPTGTSPNLSHASSVQIWNVRYKLEVSSRAVTKIGRYGGKTSRDRRRYVCVLRQYARKVERDVMSSHGNTGVHGSACDARKRVGGGERAGRRVRYGAAAHRGTSPSRRTAGWGLGANGACRAAQSTATTRLCPCRPRNGPRSGRRGDVAARVASSICARGRRHDMQGAREGLRACDAAASRRRRPARCGARCRARLAVYGIDLMRHLCQTVTPWVSGATRGRCVARE